MTYPLSIKISINLKVKRNPDGSANRVLNLNFFATFFFFSNLSFDFTFFFLS